MTINFIATALTLLTLFPYAINAQPKAYSENISIKRLLGIKQGFSPDSQ